MFQITVNQPNKKYNINLYQLGFRLSAFLVIGTGDKAKAFRRHLEAQFTKNKELIMKMTLIYREGQQHGEINLICEKGKYEFIGHVIKAFIEEYQEALEQLVSYLEAPQSPQVVQRIPGEMTSDNTPVDFSKDASQDIPEAVMKHIHHTLDSLTVEELEAIPVTMIDMSQVEEVKIEPPTDLTENQIIDADFEMIPKQ